MPLTTASRPSDSGRAYFSSIRSASWMISEISPSTGSSRSYSLRNVSKEQSSPRCDSLAPTTSNSSASSGASAGSPKNAKEASGFRVYEAPYQPDAGGAVHVAASARGPQHQPSPSAPSAPDEPSRFLTASRVSLSTAAASPLSGERK